MGEEKIQLLKKQSTKLGIFWGVFMYIFTIFISGPMINGEEISWKRAIIGIPIWALAGFWFGYINYRIQKKKLND